MLTLSSKFTFYSILLLLLLLLLLPVIDTLFKLLDNIINLVLFHVDPAELADDIHLIQHNITELKDYIVDFGDHINTLSDHLTPAWKDNVQKLDDLFIPMDGAEYRTKFVCYFTSFFLLFLYLSLYLLID